MAATLEEITRYIHQAAQQRGIDPSYALKVAKSEGLGEGVWQSNATKNGIREPSYGPFQLLVGGKGTGYPAGMGNDFQKATGLDPSNRANVKPGIDYALDRASKEGWGAWYGAKNAGITGMQGIGSNAQAKGLNLMFHPGGGQALRDGQVQPLEPPRDVASYLTMNPGGSSAGASTDLSPFDEFRTNGFRAGMKSLGGFGMLSKAFGGGGSSADPQAQAHSVPIQSTLPSSDAADAGRMQAAQQLMSALMASKPNRRLGGQSRGKSLMG